MAKEYDLEKIDAFNVFTQFNVMLNNSENISIISEYLFDLCLKKNRALTGLVIIKTGNGWIVPQSKGIVLPESFKHIADNNLLMTDELKVLLQKNNLKFHYEIKFGDLLFGKIFIDRQDLITLKDKKFLITVLSYAGLYLYNKILEVDLKKSRTSVESKVEQLSSLFDLSKEFSGMLEIDMIGKLLVFSIISQLMVAKFAVVLFTNDDLHILETKYKNNIGELLKKYDYRNFDFTLRKENIKARYSLFLDEDIELIIPMQIKGETKGLLIIGRLTSEEPFSKPDIEYLEAIGSLAIISIENANLFKETLEKQKMEKDLELAMTIQKNLLPKTFPKLKYLDMDADNISAKQVGGDYYDVVMLDDHRMLFAIADVSGKGVQAALLMANLQAFLKSICKQNLPLELASNLINDLVAENIISGSFITFFWGIFDDATKELTYVNAGHNPPLLIRNKKIKKLEAGGLILGMMKTMIPYQSETIKLKKNDMLVLFTDGVTEAMNVKSEEFSDELLEDICVKNSLKTPKQLLNTILQNLDDFTKGAEQSDDITCIILKVK
ncbi:MAG: GAF domain-containing SpoIIE family protein phosphatase [bacterium]